MMTQDGKQIRVPTEIDADLARDAFEGLLNRIDRWKEAQNKKKDILKDANNAISAAEADVVSAVAAVDEVQQGLNDEDLQKFLKLHKAFHDIDTAKARASKFRREAKEAEQAADATFKEAVERGRPADDVQAALAKVEDVEGSYQTLQDREAERVEVEKAEKGRIADAEKALKKAAEEARQGDLFE